MREIEFQEVGMENYGPYIEPMLLQFKNNSLVLITGPNGIGKTMSLDAIPFTLYGVTSKGAKPDDVVNNVVGKNCKTWLKFKLNEDKYIVTRFHKYAKLGNTVILNKNGVDIKKGHKEVLPEVEKLVCSKNSFMNTLMFGQKVKNFFTDLEDADKKGIFRNILDLDSYVLYYQEAKKQLDTLDENTKQLEKDVGIKIGILEDTRNQIQLLKDKQIEFEKQKKENLSRLIQSLEENSRLLKKWVDQVKELEKDKIDIEKLNTLINNLELQLKNQTDQIRSEKLELEAKKNDKINELKETCQQVENKYKDELETTRTNIQEQISNKKDEQFKQIKEIQDQEHRLVLELNSIDSTIRNYQEKITEITNKVLSTENASICPLCEQPVTQNTVELLQQKIDSYKFEIENLQEKSKHINNVISGILLNKSAKEEKFKDEIKKLTDNLNIIISNVNQEINNNRQKLNSTIEKVNELVLVETKKIEEKFHTEQISIQNQLLKENETKQEQEHLSKEIEKINLTINNIKLDMNSTETSIKNLEKQEYDDAQLKSYIRKEVELLNELRTLKSQNDAIEKQKEVLEFWKSGFSPSGIPSMLIDEAIPFMNKRVAEYLDKLTNGRYIVSFSTLGTTKGGEVRDKITVNVIDTYTRANSRVQLSGGQTRLVDIATILTLGDLQANIQDVKFNILLFDEIFDSLDEENIGYVAKVLSKLKEDRSIYIISHRHQDQVEYDELLSFA